MSGWFPTGRDERRGWRLDGVSLLAVLGESTMRNHAQSMTASWTCLLPRLVPAPQALLRSSRPARLPTTSAVVVGAHSGVCVQNLNFYGNIFHDLENLKPYAFEEYKAMFKAKDPGYLKLKRLSIKTLSPLSCLAYLSCAGTFFLLGWAIKVRDGVAALAIGLLSIQSMMAGLASWWSPALCNRPTNSDVPDGCVVIRTREGAIVVVHCDDEIARELYVGTEIADYWLADWISKLVMMCGTLFLMVGVVLLGNSGWTMQAAIGSAYLLLNALYWLAALCPTHWCWDFYSQYHWQPEERQFKDPNIPATRNAETEQAETEQAEKDQPSMTKTLWYAIQATGATHWVITSGAAPDTPYWKEWLRLAQENTKNVEWDAVGEKDRLMALAKAGKPVLEVETTGPITQNDIEAAESANKLPA